MKATRPSSQAIRQTALLSKRRVSGGPCSVKDPQLETLGAAVGHLAETGLVNDGY